MSKPSMKTYPKIGLTKCPTCGYTVDSATQAHGEEGMPSDGTVSVCLNCGGLGIYLADLTLRPINDEETQEVMRDWEAWSTIEKAQGYIRARGRFR